METEESFEEQAWFWIPGEDERRVPGSLELTKSVIRARLLAHLPGDEVGEEVQQVLMPRYLPTDGGVRPVLHCRLRTGHFFSMFECKGFESGGFRFPTVSFTDEGPFASHSDYWSSYAIHDVLLNEVPIFRAMQFQLDGLAEFLRRWRGLIPGNVENLGWIPRAFPPLPDLAVELPNGWRLDVSSSISNAEETLLFEVTPPEPSSLQAYLDAVLTPLVWFARFVSHSPQSLQHLKVDLGAADPEEDFFGITRWSNLSIPRSAETNLNESRSKWPPLNIDSFAPRPLEGPLDVTATFGDSTRQQLLARWCEWFAHDSNRAALTAAIGPVASSGPIGVDEHIRAVVGALEELAIDRVPPLPDSELEARSQIAAQLDKSPQEFGEMLHVPVASVAWLSQRVRDSMQKGQRRQLQELIEAHEDLLASVLYADGPGSESAQTAKQLADSISALRGALSHRGRAGSGAQHQRRWVLHQARVVLMSVVLSELVTDRALVRDVVQRLGSTTHWHSP